MRAGQQALSSSGYCRRQSFGSLHASEVGGRPFKLTPVALLQRIRLAATADDATALKAFAIAGYCPTSYLSKNLRGALVDTAYALDRKAVNAGLRRFLLRLAVDFSVLGPLVGGTNARLTPGD